jgi:hypothetical protein
MTNPYYNSSGAPAYLSRGNSGTIDAEYDLVAAGFDGVNTVIGTTLPASIALKGNIAGQTWTGTHNFPATTYGVTAAFGASGTAFATLDFVNAVATSAVLPGQTGNSGKLLTTDGSVASWTAVKTINGVSILAVGDVRLALVLLATIAPTAAANVDFLTTFTSSYSNYLVIGNGITVGTTDTLRARFAVAGVVDSGSNYFEGSVSSQSAGSTITAAQSHLSITHSVYGTGKGASFTLHVRNANDATNLKTTSCECAHQETVTPGYRFQNYMAAYSAANAVSGISFYWSGGNNFAATGTIRVYGYNNT